MAPDKNLSANIVYKKRKERYTIIYIKQFHVLVHLLVSSKSWWVACASECKVCGG